MVAAVVDSSSSAGREEGQQEGGRRRKLPVRMSVSRRVGALKYSALTRRIEENNNNFALAKKSISENGWK